MIFDVPDTPYTPKALDEWHSVALRFNHDEYESEAALEFLQFFAYPPPAIFFCPTNEGHELLHRFMNQWIYMCPAVVGAKETDPRFSMSVWTEILSISSGTTGFFTHVQASGEFEDISRSAATKWLRGFIPNIQMMTTPDINDIVSEESAQIALADIIHRNFMDELTRVDADMGVRRARGELRRLETELFPPSGTDKGIGNTDPSIRIRALLALHSFIDKWDRDKPTEWEPPREVLSNPTHSLVIIWQHMVILYYLDCVHRVIDRRPSIPHRRR